MSTRALPSRSLSSRLGSASSITLPAQPRPGHARTSSDVVGMSLFWGFVGVVVLAALLLYCMPAGKRISQYQAALDQAEAQLEEAQAKHAALELEREALDDPFTVEWILRREHNWQPTDR